MREPPPLNPPPLNHLGGGDDMSKVLSLYVTFCILLDRTWCRVIVNTLTIFAALDSLHVLYSAEKALCVI